MGLNDTQQRADGTTHKGAHRGSRCFSTASNAARWPSTASAFWKTARRTGGRYVGGQGETESKRR